MSRKQARKQELAKFHKDSILRAANDLFRKNGIRKTTMDDIARVSDYTKPTIYAYFGGKEDILHHLMLDCYRHLRDTMRDAAANYRDFRSFFLVVCETLLLVHDEHPVYFKGIIGGLSSFGKKGVGEEVVAAIRAVGEEINDLGVDMLKRGMQQGEIRHGIDPLESLFVLWSSVCGLIAVASNKTGYLSQRLGRDRETVLRDGFAGIFLQIARPSPPAASTSPKRKAH